MEKALRIVVGVPGVLFVVQGLGWVFRPAQTAEQLGMPLLDGVGRSTQMGDLGSFFLSLGVMILLGVTTQRATWLRAAGLLLGVTAVLRLLAFASHDAALPVHFIAVEVLVAALLLFAASRLPAHA